MNGKKFFLAATILASIIAICAGRASAALLGLVPNYPQITFDSLSFSNPYGTSFDANTRVLSVTATPVTYFWAYRKPLAITGSKTLSIQAHLDSSGNLVPDAPGDGIVLTGDIVPNGFYTGPAYYGTLLTGKISRFGYFNGGTTDSYDFRFTPTGGALLDQYGSYDIGVTLTSENSTFNGVFTASFTGIAKGTAGRVAGPHLDLVESCTDATGQGQPIMLSATLTNSGTEALKDITCSSSPEAWLSGIPTTDLAVGASAIITGSYLPDTSPSTASVTCSGTGSGSLVTVTKSSSATCKTPATPAFSLQASCSDAAGPGKPILMSATITNTGSETLTGFNCYDSQGSSVSGAPISLTPGATARLAASYVPTGSGSTDTIYCNAKGLLDNATVSSSSSATCNIITIPVLAVSETCTGASAPGESIYLTAVVSNPGNEPLVGLSCSDSKGAVLTGVPATLAPGATATVKGSYIPTSSGSTDVITCRAQGAINSAAVSAESSSTCDIKTNPILAVAETCSNATAPGQPINLTAVVSNPGNEPLVGLSCSDSKGTVLTGVPATLAPGATATVKGSYIPTSSKSTDVITCHAQGAINSAAVSANGNSTCDIVTRPQLAVFAGCTNAPAPGQPIAISGTVTNTGNEPLTGLTCSDNRGGALAGVPATLNPGTSAIVTGSYTPSSSPSTDTITCSATGVINGATVGENSSSTCTILNPKISIRKLTNGIDAPTGSGPTLPFGSAVTWTYIVTNTGNTTLTNVTVTDNRVAGVFCPLTILAPGASMTCSATGTAIAGQYENIGKAVGSSGGVTVTSTYPSHYVGSTTLGCTSTIGYWKNHPEKWPVTTLTLGTVRYSQTELLAILQNSVTGNGLLTLAHQLIGAKLNLASGTSLTPTVQKYLTIADSMIGGLVVPPIGSGYLPPPTTSAVEMVLDSYNNGVAANGPDHCD